MRHRGVHRPDKWAEIRRRVLVDGLGKRAARREYGIHYKTKRVRNGLGVTQEHTLVFRLIPQ